jgi:26S proteasome regulatory subunit T6
MLHSYSPRCLIISFCLDRGHAPSIIFMDEIDSIGSARMESSGSGDSEVQRTMLELLN